MIMLFSDKTLSKSGPLQGLIMCARFDTYIYIYISFICIYKYFSYSINMCVCVLEGTQGVVTYLVVNVLVDSSSNPRLDCLHF